MTDVSCIKGVNKTTKWLFRPPLTLFKPFWGKINAPLRLENAPNSAHEFLYKNFNKKI